MPRMAHRRHLVPAARYCGVCWLGVVIGCGPPEYTIEPVNGPLTIEVRNIGDTPLNVTRQVGLWGTIGTGNGSLRVNGQAMEIEANGTFSTVVPLPEGEPAVLRLIASLGDSSISRDILVHRTSAARVESTIDADTVLRTTTGWVRLHRPPSDTADAPTQARPIYSRWTPGGALAIALPQETTWPIDAELRGSVRLLLSGGTAVWVPRDEAITVAASSQAMLPGTTVDVVSDIESAIIRIPLQDATASTVDLLRDTVTWTVYRATLPAMRQVIDDSLLREVEVSMPVAGEVRVRGVLAGPVLGWRVRFVNGAMQLELRRDRVTSLRGLRVAVDAGHPPGGATGPSGTREDALTLRVAREMAQQLESRGATPILIRNDTLPLSLDARLVRAEASGAHVFVSLHADAPGDGRHPATADFTRVHWWQPMSRALAADVLDSLAPALGTRADDAPRNNLAVLRASWFPAVLVEPTTIALPHREAFLASERGVQQYAAGLVAGIAAWAEGPRHSRFATSIQASAEDGRLRRGAQ
jgi:N-acetylmuramoyl-L-alanine amidase